LKGTIAATTPNGSLTVKFTWCSKLGGMLEPRE
jgi:hypothetical protein